MNRIIGLIKQYGISPVKGLGQNFLIDDNIIGKLKEAISPELGDYIIEIGPGLGSLTEALVGHCSMLFGIEIDKRLFNIINERFGGFPGFVSGNFDVLELRRETPLPKYDQSAIQKIKITGNLPYYITTPIIMKFLEEDFPFHAMYFMMQKEVAVRILAKPGTKDYGALTVAVNYYCLPRHVISVPPHCFLPQPKVASTFMAFEKRENPVVDVNDKDWFFTVVRAAFNQRRKNLVNALFNNPSIQAKITKEKILAVVSAMGLDSDIRGECLDFKTFADLSNLLQKE